METTTAPELCTSREAAKRIHVTVATINNYARDGKLPSYTLPGGFRRFRIEDVMALLTPSSATDGDT